MVFPSVDDAAPHWVVPSGKGETEPTEGWGGVLPSVFSRWSDQISLRQLVVCHCYELTQPFHSSWRSRDFAALLPSEGCYSPEGCHAEGNMRATGAWPFSRAAAAVFCRGLHVCPAAKQRGVNTKEERNTLEGREGVFATYGPRQMTAATTEWQKAWPIWHPRTVHPPRRSWLSDCDERATIN